jgi:hypothetical protein
METQPLRGTPATHPVAPLRERASRSAMIIDHEKLSRLARDASRLPGYSHESRIVKNE